MDVKFALTSEQLKALADFAVAMSEDDGGWLDDTPGLEEAITKLNHLANSMPPMTLIAMTNFEMIIARDAIDLLDPEEEEATNSARELWSRLHLAIDDGDEDEDDAEGEEA